MRTPTIFRHGATALKLIFLLGLTSLLFGAAPASFAAEVNSAVEVPTPLDAANPGAQRRRFDPLNPAMLNEAAMQHIRDGDVGTAAILLERAVLLAPYDKRIRQNLQTLRAWQSGKPMPAAAGQKPEAPAAGTDKPTGDDAGGPASMPVPIWKPVE